MTRSTDYSIALHGGAGTLLREKMTPEKERLYREALLSALMAGDRILKSGGSALDAVVETTMMLENSTLFNAGRGAVFTHNGEHELDASLMEGASRKAGAVCSVKRVENPIRLCRHVMESEFVMLNGEGAEEFAREVGIPMVENSFFSTEQRQSQLEQARLKGVVQLDHSDEADKNEKYGTVGAVARDLKGNLAAATSTGGMTNKRYGRIGDSALIGSGNWADNRSCALSATGWGEFFIRSSVAARIAGMVEYGKISLGEAARKMLSEEVAPLGGDGGVIALDPKGEVVLHFNSEGMYRAWIEHGGDPMTAIFADDAVVHGRL